MDSLIYIGLTTYLFALTPGMNNVALFAKAAREGVRPAAAMALGELAGDTIYVVAAILSLGALATLLAPVVPLLKYMAAGLLIYMGVRAWRSAGAPRVAAKPSLSLCGNALLGFLLCASNPKVIAYYLAFFPLFVDLRKLTLGSGALIVLAVLGAIALGLVSVIALARLAHHLPCRRVATGVWQRIFGSFMVGLGVAVTAS